MVPLALSALSMAAPGLFQMGAGLKQKIEANKVRLQDTRPETFKEILALRRQQANNQLMPGQKTAEQRVGQSMADANNMAAQTGRGSSGLLANLQRLQYNANRATLDMANNAAAYQANAKDNLAGALAKDAAWEKNDMDAFTNKKAVLREDANNNIMGGLSNIGMMGVLAASGEFDAAGKPKQLKPVTSIDPITPKAAIPQASSNPFLNNLSSRINGYSAPGLSGYSENPNDPSLWYRNNIWAPLYKLKTPSPFGGPR